MPEFWGAVGQGFESSQAFKQTVGSDARSLKLANVFNFNLSKFNVVLTPEERAERLRKRAMNRQREADRARIKQSALNVAKFAGTAVGAAAGMYGGASNMVYSVMVGGMSAKAPGAVVRTVKAAGETGAAIGREIDRFTEGVRDGTNYGRESNYEASPNLNRATRRRPEHSQRDYRNVEQGQSSYDQSEEALRAREHIRNNMQL